MAASFFYMASSAHICHNNSFTRCLTSLFSIFGVFFPFRFYKQGLYKKNPAIFSEKTNNARLVSSGVEVYGTVMCMSKLFPPINSVRRWQSAFGMNVYSDLPSQFYFFQNSGETRASSDSVKGMTLIETIWKIHQVFGNGSMTTMQITEWCSRFKNDRTLVRNGSRCSKYSAKRNNEVINKIRIVVETFITIYFAFPIQRTAWLFSDKLV